MLNRSLGINSCFIFIFIVIIIAKQVPGKNSYFNPDPDGLSPAGIGRDPIKTTYSGLP